MADPDDGLGDGDVDAVGPALAVSAFSGLVVGAVTGGALALDRRRVRS